jgi:hypothetical protein
MSEGRPTRWFVNPAVHETFAAKAVEEREARSAAQNSIREEGSRRRAERAVESDPETILHPAAPLQDSMITQDILA